MIGYVTRPMTARPGPSAMAAWPRGRSIAVTRLIGSTPRRWNSGAAAKAPPGGRGEEGDQAFYGAYFRDLDGNKLCAFRVGPAG